MFGWCQAEHGYQDKRGISSNDEYAEQVAAGKLSKKALRRKPSGFYQDDGGDDEWPLPGHKEMLEEDVHVCVICDVGSDVFMHVHICVCM